MATRDIRTTDARTACDVCGRTLLRGEHAEIYLNGTARRSVCDLCTARALHEGWIREGTAPPDQGLGAGTDRRRSLLSRLRARRDPSPRRDPTAEPDLPAPAAEERGPEPSRRRVPSDSSRRTTTPEPSRRVPAPEPPRRARERIREPRHVRAVPTSVEHKIASAIDVFNNSEHRRTVAGVARSLGAPTVAVRPVHDSPSLVNVVASWELCWYRYEIDLSDEVPGVRLSAQGYELDELGSEDRTANAVSDERGSLSLSA